jgi:hypothetical protein
MDTATPAPPPAPELPEPTPYEGFIRWRMFHLCARALRSSESGPICNAQPLTANEMLRIVACAKKWNFLPPGR